MTEQNNDDLKNRVRWIAVQFLLDCFAPTLLLDWDLLEALNLIAEKCWHPICFA